MSQDIANVVKQKGSGEDESGHAGDLAKMIDLFRRGARHDLTVQSCWERKIVT
jgi:hypothetical protein